MTTFLGLGAMGRALTTATLDAGEPVTVWNRTARPVDERAAVAGSVREAVAAPGPIVACLFDHASVHAVLDPVAADLSGRTLINLTTTTPGEARELASWAAAHGADHLDGAVMAVPEMIGRPGATILYSGSLRVFERHRSLLDRWAGSTFTGPDAGLAALWDTAMLTGMYTMVAGFLHGAAMVRAAGVPAAAFAGAQAPFLAAMTGGLAGYAATVDAADYAGPGQQSLRFTEAALTTLLRATAELGMTAEVLQPVHDLVRRQIAAGHGDHGTARIYEELGGPR